MNSIRKEKEKRCLSLCVVKPYLIPGTRFVLRILNAFNCCVQLHIWIIWHMERCLKTTSKNFPVLLGHYLRFLLKEVVLNGRM